MVRGPVTASSEHSVQEGEPSRWQEELTPAAGAWCSGRAGAGVGLARVRGRWDTSRSMLFLGSGQAA